MIGLVTAIFAICVFSGLIVYTIKAITKEK